LVHADRNDHPAHWRRDRFEAWQNKNHRALAVLIVVAIVGKTVFVSLASMLIGERPDTAVKSGFAMGQVGTFSILFAVAAAGDAMGSLLYSLAAIANPGL
jgi:Kef-type K+ transport system membrane component KefB